MSLQTLATRRRVAGALAVVLSTGVCALASHALADGSAGTTQAAQFGKETWYQPDPSCTLPTGCLSLGTALPPVNPYGAGTLHVSVSAGQRTGSIYLAVNAVAVPAGDVITKAVFTAPLDTGNAGSVMPDTSTTQVCTSSTAIAANEGEFDDPPADTDCHTAYQPLTYAATPTPELTGDLTALLNAHLSDLTAGKLDLAILPYNYSMTATWHDVLDSNDGTATTTTPTLALTFGASDAAAAPTTVDTSPVASSTASAPSTKTATATAVTAVAVSNPAAPVAAPVAAAPISGAAPVSVAAAPVSDGAASAAPEPQVASSDAPAPTDQAPAASDTAPQVTTVAASKTIGFAYPGVLLLPLLLAAGGVGLARVMTRDVTPKKPGA